MVVVPNIWSRPRGFSRAAFAFFVLMQTAADTLCVSRFRPVSPRTFVTAKSRAASLHAPVLVLFFSHRR